MSFNAAIYMVHSSVFLSFLKGKRDCARGSTILGTLPNTAISKISLGKVAKKGKLMKLYFNCRFREKRDRNRRVTDQISSQYGD